jgi:hypothetical protein
MSAESTGKVWATHPTSGQKQHYGLSSMYYFITRIGAYLSSQLEQPQMGHQAQPNTASRVFSSPTSLGTDHRGGSMMLKEGPKSGDFLTRAQEEYFLSLFWQTYHCAFPILNEADFKRYHKSLWVGSPPAGHLANHYHLRALFSLSAYIMVRPTYLELMEISIQSQLLTAVMQLLSVEIITEGVSH